MLFCQGIPKNQNNLTQRRKGAGKQERGKGKLGVGFWVLGFGCWVLGGMLFEAELQYNGDP